MKDLQFPVGISNFEKIREGGYYYIDKTNLISELLSGGIAEVTLITRPRRFGKSLGMSTLANFLDIRKDSKQLFEGLAISKNTELCKKWMNQCPVVFFSFKDTDGLTFESAYGMLCMKLAFAFQDYQFLLDDDAISDDDKGIFKRILGRTASMDEPKSCFLLLTRMLEIHFKKSAVVILDEYDVPIAKASSNGYYSQMLDVMRAMMSTTLKDNTSLDFAVITGCLKIAKESIFTGTNNFVSDTILSTRLSESFGFTQADVDQMLNDADLESQSAEIKAWYDGYHFGDADIYCPWDVISYLRDFQYGVAQKPKSYWKNTSDNAIIRSFIDYAGDNITTKLETLMADGSIVQHIEENLTYDGKFDFSLIRCYDIALFIDYIILNGKSHSCIKLLFGWSVFLQIRKHLVGIDLILHMLIGFFHLIRPVKILWVLFDPCTYKINSFLRFFFFHLCIQGIICSAIGGVFLSSISNIVVCHSTNRTPAFTNRSHTNATGTKNLIDSCMSCFMCRSLCNIFDCYSFKACMSFTIVTERPVILSVYS